MQRKLRTLGRNSVVCRFVTSGTYGFMGKSGLLRNSLSIEPPCHNLDVRRGQPGPTERKPSTREHHLLATALYLLSTQLASSMKLAHLQTPVSLIGLCQHLRLGIGKYPLRAQSVANLEHRKLVALLEDFGDVLGDHEAVVKS